MLTYSSPRGAKLSKTYCCAFSYVIFISTSCTSGVNKSYIRSEERRVGKECIYQLPSNQNKKQGKGTDRLDTKCGQTEQVHKNHSRTGLRQRFLTCHPD